MTEQELVRAAKALVLRFHGDTWIDYDLTASIVIELLDTFQGIDRESVLKLLASELSAERIFNEENAQEVRDYFGPVFVVMSGDAYWNTAWRSLEPDLVNATYFTENSEVEEAVKDATERSDFTPENRKVIEIPYPHWKGMKHEFNT